MRWVHPRGSLADGNRSVAVDDTIDGWHHTRLFIVELSPGERYEIDCEGIEYMVIPLAGGARAEIREDSGDVTSIDLMGRPDVFAGPTDVAYLPPGCTAALTAPARSRIALAGSVVYRAALPGEPARLRAADVPVEQRGSGECSRLVRNFGTPGVMDADSLICCEVITPSGNWSSYPPHKHDVEDPGVETRLEEIYYFETRAVDGAPPQADPCAYHRVYASDHRPIDVLAEVRSGDVVLVPYGWHGPSMAPPSADLYYLNVMAGPGRERAWLITDDPAHGWVRERWRGQPFDPRIAIDG